MSYLPFTTALVGAAACAAYPFAAIWLWHKFLPERQINWAVLVMIPAMLVAISILIGQLVWVAE